MASRSGRYSGGNGYGLQSTDSPVWSPPQDTPSPPPAHPTPCRTGASGYTASPPPPSAGWGAEERARGYSQSPSRTQFDGWVTRAQSAPPADPYRDTEAWAEGSGQTLEEMVSLVGRGDWFFKIDWQGRPTKRWFWVDKKGWKLYWATSDEPHGFHSGSVALTEMIRIELGPIDFLRQGGGSTPFWTVRIWSGDRRLIFSTQHLSKFRKWAGALLHITRRYRRHNAASNQHRTDVHGRPFLGLEWGAVMLA
eukprot:TRINITY_DN25707_c0_g1_i1.p1 TRINITY_DN25707_c0_g1~~TRINITY_DN25707_c0_g1_i1.p1  ORF type:complete len:251 (+),score=60.09 TRINITY_DN25707_c0_g1_i1:53-805(+)